MNTLTEQIRIYSEDGEADINREITLKMVGNDPNCPITFYVDDKAVFSLGSDEVDDFRETLKSLVP